MSIQHQVRKQTLLTLRVNNNLYFISLFTDQGETVRIRRAGALHRFFHPSRG
jgi:hypothetical protein